MISKIEHIKNIGNFEDYNAAGDVSFKKVNIIYADNGAGKTTLSQVFHSLATDDASIIGRHKRIGATDQSEVTIKDDTNHLHIFNGTKWNRPIPEIEVFDAHFVADNVYSGFEINSDHHKGLYQFVVGASGVAMVEKIERVKTRISDKNDELKSVAGLIMRTADNNDCAKVCGLVKHQNIDSEITEKQQELATARNGEQIRTHDIPHTIQLPELNIDCEQTKEVLQVTVEGIGSDYLERVKAQLKKLGDAGMTNGTNWVYNGVKTITEEKKCPFCGQDLKGAADLIDGYNQYFSKAYNDAVEAANRIRSSFEKWNVDSFSVQLVSQYERIKDIMRFWESVIPLEGPLPEYPISELKLVERYQKVLAAIREKAANPVGEVSTDYIDALNTALLEVKRLTDVVNKYVTDYVTKITALRAKLRPVADVEKELKLLMLNKARYEQPLMGYCNMYGILDKQISRLNHIKTVLQQQQKAASASLFQQYGQATNDYLQNKFKTAFQIVDVKDAFRGAAKRPNLEYTLTFNGTPIMQGDDGGSNTSFKNVLSEGDKNTVAFSFFMAKITQDPNLANKIVVFDDPLTSLDQNRRNATIDQLVLLHSRCKQLIVLSHNFHFLIDFNARGEIKKADKKVLVIVKGLNTEIQPFELKREWMDKYKWAVLAMEDFVNTPIPTEKENVINSIRLTLELMLKLKFCKYISNPDETFGEVITDLERSSCVFVNPNKTDVIAKLRELNNISWRGHHAAVEERAIYREQYLTMTEARNYVIDTLSLLNSGL